MYICMSVSADTRKGSANADEARTHAKEVRTLFVRTLQNASANCIWQGVEALSFPNAFRANADEMHLRANADEMLHASDMRWRPHKTQ